MSASQNPTALFVADSHFHLQPDPAEAHRVERFLAFLKVARRADHLVLLGDVFDFWFDYPHFRLKGYDSLLNALDAVCDAGTRLHFIGGNHDIWAAGYLHERYGSSPDGKTATLLLDDRRIRLCHGDGLLSHDLPYNTFRAIVRTRAGIVVAKSLHPELLHALSTWLSGRSRTADRDEASKIVAKARTWIERQADVPWDLMVMGHVHHAFKVSAHGRSLAALAGWLDTLGYGILRDGDFRLADFSDGTDPLA